jgi:hypothetical protein
MVKTKNEKNKKKEGNNDKGGKDDQQHGKEVLKEQAKILYRIIKGIPED